MSAHIIMFSVCVIVCACVCVCMDQFHFSFVTRSLKSCTVKREQERKFFFRFWCHFFTRREMWWKKNSGGSKILFELMANHSRFGIRISNHHLSLWNRLDSIVSFRFFLYIYIFSLKFCLFLKEYISKFGYHSYKFEFSVLNLGNIFYFFFVSNHFSKKKEKKRFENW